jgi:outer membrane protein TolC
MRESDINIEVQQLSIRQQKAQGRPSVGLNASWAVVGVSNDDIHVSYPNSFNYAWGDIKRRPSNFAIGIDIRIPIIDWGRNRRLVRVAQARQQQNLLAKDDQERNIETEVRTLVARMQSYLSRHQLLEKNVALAEKSFNITLERFSNDDITSDGLAEERRRLNLAYDNHLSAYVQYQLGLADLARKTFYDFKNDQPIE